MSSAIKKTKVLSLRISLEDLQSCFDLCTKAKHPTSIASSAISRSLSVLLSSMRASGALPSYSSRELSELCASYKEKVNPTSMPSLELSSICSLEGHQTFCAEKAFTLQKPSICATPTFCAEKVCAETQTFERSQTDSEILEDEILRQMKEIELEDEVDLLSKILIS